MANIIKVFINIVHNHKTDIQNITQGSNRANSMGEGLEEYIKDIFANTLDESNPQTKLINTCTNSCFMIKY